MTNVARAASALPAHVSSVIERVGIPLHRMGDAPAALQSGAELAPGLHQARLGVAETTFAFNDHRQALWRQMERSLETLSERYGATHVAGAGSYFGTAKARPADIDMAVFSSGGFDTTASQYFNRVHGRGTIEAFPADAGRFPGGPTMLSFFRNDRDGVARPMVLLDLAELVGRSR